jgi:O-methyltransferase
MHRALESEGLSHVRLLGFDSFQGLPPEAANEGSVTWVPGAYKSSLAATRRYLSEKGVDWSRVTLIEGWFKDTLTPETKARLNIESAGLIMIDCDIYSASRDALWFCQPFIRDRAVIFLDDWGSNMGNIGQKEAFEEFLAEFPQLSAEPLPSYGPQARVFLITRRVA